MDGRLRIVAFPKVEGNGLDGGSLASLVRQLFFFRFVI